MSLDSEEIGLPFNRTIERFEIYGDYFIASYGYCGLGDFRQEHALIYKHPIPNTGDRLSVLNQASRERPYKIYDEKQSVLFASILDLYKHDENFNNESDGFPKENIEEMIKPLSKMYTVIKEKDFWKNLRRLTESSVVCLCCRKANTNIKELKSMKKKVLCTALAAMMLVTTTASAEPWWLIKYRVTFDNELGIVGNVTLTFPSDGGSFIRPITKRYGESISLESYVPTKYGYTFKGWFSDPRTKQNQVTEFKFTKPDVLYAKWEKNPEEPINKNDEIMSKDTCYLTDEKTKIRNEIIEEKNKNYIDGFGYVAPAKTKTIIVDSDGDINKMVGTME